MGRSRGGGGRWHCRGRGGSECTKLGQDLLELLLRDADLNE